MAGFPWSLMVTCEKSSIERSSSRGRRWKCSGDFSFSP
uniref:Uncharacterized protein n=1 Tax=Arundo donax TaxID=35708 RepID=A0A0A9FH52_ARUDO